MQKEIIRAAIDWEFESNPNWCFDGEMNDIVKRALKKAELKADKKEFEKFMRIACKVLKDMADKAFVKQFRQAMEKQL